MSYPRLAERLFNQPLLISPDKADVLAAVFNAHLEGRVADLPKYEPPPSVDLATSIQMRRTDGGYYLTNHGIAVVPVHGTLVQRGDSMDAASGMTGYNRIANQIGAAIRDPGVRGVVMEFDSPGGEVPGVIELATLITESEKPVYAHANELAASAAYWLAAASDKLFAPTTGLLGSIGVLMMHADRSKQHERAGVVYTPVYAGERKLDGSSMQPLSEEARAWAQSRVDQVYALFVSHVAKQRNVSEKKVRDTEAAIYSVQEATTKSLADGVATLGDTIQMMTDELNAGRSKRKSYGRAAANAQSQQENEMSKEEQGAAPKQPAAITQELLDKAVADARADERTKVAAEATASAAKDAQGKADAAAKERVAAILGCDEAKERRTLAEHLALRTDDSVDKAKATLAASPKEAGGNALDAAMRALGNKTPGADTDKGGKHGTSAGIDSSEIYASRRQQTLHAVK